MTVKSDRQILEDAIAADFDDVAAHSAYADLLMEHGDPRGEYIQLKLALEDPGRPASIREEAGRRAAALYMKHEPDWLGSLAALQRPPRRRFTPDPERPNVEIRPRRGWVTALDVVDVTDDIVRIVASAPEARMVQELTLLNTVNARPMPDLRRIAESPYLRSLRGFELGDRNLPYPVAEGYAAAAVVAVNPGLRRIVLRARGTHVGEIFRSRLPELRELRIDFAPCPVHLLAENVSLGRLTHLWLDPRDEWLTDLPETVGGTIESEMIEAFFASPHLGSITRLTLRLTGIGDLAAAAAVRHGWLSRLERLDLCQTGMTDQGALELAGCPELASLTQLDVQGNRLTERGIGALRRFDIRLHARYQEGGYGGGADDFEGFPPPAGGTDVVIVDE